MSTIKNDPVIIEGFYCYAPKLAFENDGFNEKSFELLFQREMSHFWFRSRNRMLENLVSKYSGSGKFHFLEVGCGTGIVLTKLSECKNIDLTGSEIHISGLRYARQRLPEVDFIQLDATDIPFHDQFEAVGAFDVIEHIENDILVLNNFFKALKPNGMLYITVPQYPFMWSYLDDIAFHKRRYTFKELVTKVENAGFTIKYSSSYVCTLFPFMLLSRLYQKGKKNKDINDSDIEFRIGKIANWLFENLMRIDEFFIRLGISLPFGGSLIVVAQKKVIN